MSKPINIVLNVYPLDWYHIIAYLICRYSNDIAY